MMINYRKLFVALLVGILNEQSKHASELTLFLTKCHFESP